MAVNETKEVQEKLLVPNQQRFEFTVKDFEELSYIPDSPWVSLLDNYVSDSPTTRFESLNVLFYSNYHFIIIHRESKSLAWAARGRLSLKSFRKMTPRQSLSVRRQ